MSTTLSLTNLTDHLNRDRTIARDSVRWKKTRGPLTRILVPVLNADTSNGRLTAPVVTDERVVRSNVSSTVFLRIAGDLVVLALMVLLSVTGGTVFSVSEAEAATCGNGVIESGEACDDANLTSNDGCSATCAVEQECYDIGNTFSFFSWSDSYTSAGGGSVRSVFEDAVDESKYPSRVIPRFWISTGDIPFMVDGNGTLDDLNSTVSGILFPFSCSASNGQFPYFVAIGNHDVDGYDGANGTTPQTQYNYWSTYVGPKLTNTLVGLKNFREGPKSADGHDARTTYSFDYKNAHFVVVNQYYQDPLYPTSNPLACIRQSLYDWIDQDLAQTTRPLKFVFGHEPAWSYCSTENGFGGTSCPVGSLDNQNPPQRRRPYSSLGPWLEPFGGHWGDSLEDTRCPNVVVGSVSRAGRDAFWSMLANRGVVAHFNGHTHTYSSRLVQGNGVPRNDISAYTKTGQQFLVTDGVWGVEDGQTHNSAGAAYVLTTVRDNVVTFESYDQLGSEPFKKIESWSVAVGDSRGTNRAPVLNAIGARTVNVGTSVSFTATATDSDTGQTLTYSLRNPPAGASINGTSGVFNWTPTTTGTFTFTVVVTDNGTPALTASQSVTVTVGTTTTTLSVSPSSVARGSSVTASWANIATPTTKDWLGVYVPGTPDTHNLAWRYTTGAASGNAPFTIPTSLAPGTYELRLFANNGFTRLATSPPFTVTASTTTTFSVSPSSVARGGSVTASWANIATPTATDWIGVYVPGTSNTWSLAWRYTTGAVSSNVSFTIPASLAPGTYELRLFANNGFTRLATSSAFTVTGP